MLIATHSPGVAGFSIQFPVIGPRLRKPSDGSRMPWFSDGSRASRWPRPWPLIGYLLSRSAERFASISFRASSSERIGCSR